MIKPAVLDAMVAAGCTAEQIAAAVKADQARSSGAERQARYRERHKASLVTSRDVTTVTVTGPVPPKEKSPTPPKEITPSSSEPNGSSLSVRDFFGEFWTAYPAREGSNPRKPAKQRFDRLVANGADPDRIIAAAIKLATEHPSPSRFVPQAITFLNQERFADDEARPAMTGDEFCADEWPNTRFLVIRYRDEHHTDPPRSERAGKAGYMLPAEWVTASRQRAANG